jgi:xylulokinase
VSADATILSRSSTPYLISSPFTGWAESDPYEWLAAAEEATRQAIAHSPEAPETVGFSGQMHGVVVTDASLKPLRPAILWADTRSAAEARRMTFFNKVNCVVFICFPNFAFFWYRTAIV